MGVTWSGTRQLKGRLSVSVRAAPSLLASALFIEAETIMTRSKELVPVDTGTLRASGQVQPPEISSGKVSVTMGYGGAASAYALVQHERTDYHHEVGQAKYLEQPVNEAEAGLSRRLGQRVRKLL